MLLVGVSVRFESTDLKGSHARLLAVESLADSIETGDLQLVEAFFDNVPIGPLMKSPTRGKDDRHTRQDRGDHLECNF